MNRIKEVLEQKEIKQTWLAENSERVTIWSMPMLKTDNNQDLKR